MDEIIEGLGEFLVIGLLDGESKDAKRGCLIPLGFVLLLGLAIVGGYYYGVL
jgi:hypothetical protein